MNKNLHLLLSCSLYEYSLLNCTNDENSTGLCTIHDDDDNGCVPYPPRWNFTAAMTSARVFSAMASILVFIVMIMLLVAMCFIIKQRTWMIITVMLLIATLFQGLVFTMKEEFFWCSEPEITCHLGNHAYQTITGCCFNFAIAVGTGYLARVGKRYEDNARDMRAPFRRFKERIRGFSEA